MQLRLLKPAVEKISRSWKIQMNLLANHPPTETPITREGIVVVYWMLVDCAFENRRCGLAPERAPHIS
jgi:hypothetical protein